MRLLTIGLLATIAAPLPAQTTIPEKFRATWVLDEAASQTHISDSDSYNALEKQKLLQGLEGMAGPGMKITVTGGSLAFQIGTGRPDDDPVDVIEQGSDFVVVANPGDHSQTATLRLVNDDELSLEGIGDFEGLVFLRADSTATASAPPGRGVGADVVDYYDALKECAPGEYPLVAPGFGSFTHTINGSSEGRCSVRTKYKQFSLTCAYSDETIALLTSAKKYQDARNGVFQGSTDSEESRRANEECKVD